MDQITSPISEYPGDTNTNKASSRSDRKSHLIMTVFMTMIIVAGFILPLPGKNGIISNIPSVCVFWHVTHLPCPGCGLTRAFVCISHGHWLESLIWHPLGWLMYIAVISSAIHNYYYWRTGKFVVPMSPKAMSYLGTGVLAVTVIAGTIRTIWYVLHHMKFMG